MVELNLCKRKLTSLSEYNEKNDRIESRIVYLENLLRSIEKENGQFKIDIKNLEGENSDFRKKNSLLTNDLSNVKATLETTRSSEEVAKKTFEEERIKLIHHNNTVNDEVFMLKHENHGMVNSIETDKSIIKHLEEKLKRQEILLEKLTGDSDKSFQNNLKNETKAAEYKQKVKKCAAMIENLRADNAKYQEDNRLLGDEKQALRQSVHEIKLKESDLILQTTRERKEFEQSVNNLNDEKQALLQKIFDYEQIIDSRKRQSIQSPLSNQYNYVTRHENIFHEHPISPRENENSMNRTDYNISRTDIKSNPFSPNCVRNIYQVSDGNKLSPRPFHNSEWMQRNGMSNAYPASSSDQSLLSSPTSIETDGHGAYSSQFVPHTIRLTQSSRSVSQKYSEDETR